MKNTFRVPAAIRLITLLLLPNALPLSGCSSLQSIVRPPQVALQQVNVKDPSLTEATLVFALQVTNPNSFGVSVNGIEYDLKLNGRNFTSGEIEDGFKLAKNEASTVNIPIRLNYLDVFSSLKELSRSGKAPYELTGSVKTGVVNVPFSESGTVDLSRN